MGNNSPCSSRPSSSHHYHHISLLVLTVPQLAHSVRKSQNRLIVTLPNLAISPLQPNPHDPRRRSAQQRKPRRSTHSNRISRLIIFRPEVRCPDKRSISNSINNRQRRSLFFLRLSTRRAHPTQNDRIDRVRANGKDNHPEISHSGIQRRSAEHKAENRDGFGYSDMPRAFVEFSRTVRIRNRQKPRNQIRRTRQNQSNRPIKPQRLHGSREEIFESIRGQMHVLHESEEPQFGI